LKTPAPPGGGDGAGATRHPRERVVRDGRRPGPLRGPACVTVDEGESTRHPGPPQCLPRVDASIRAPPLSLSSIHPSVVPYLAYACPRGCSRTYARTRRDWVPFSSVTFNSVRGVTARDGRDDRHGRVRDASRTITDASRDGKLDNLEKQGSRTEPGFRRLLACTIVSYHKKSGVTAPSP